jgi:serine/threonine protein kinase
MDLEQIGKYKIVGRLGQGAMGEVFKAQDLVLKRFVALKRISPSLLADDQFRKRFRREAESAAQLNHPNIVTVFEFSEEKGEIYLVMELLEGKDLKEMIARQGLARLEDKLLVMEQICEGLAYAHSKGVIHRDLKPANIRVLPNLATKILDFGLARLGVSEMTRTGTVMGTPNYMSPEQVRGEKVDERSDLFSVGAVFYELLSGHKPFDSESVHSILYEVLEHDPQPLRSWVPDLPPLLLPIVDRALAKDPEKRYASAGQMREEVRAARRAIAAGKSVAELLQPGSDSEATIVGRDSPTIAELGGARTTLERPMVEGATALDLSSTSMDRSMPETARPEPTLYPARSAWRGVVVGLVSLAVLVALGLLVWMRVRGPVAPTPTPADLAKEQEGALREQLVTSQVELARTYLDNKDYAEAVNQAELVLRVAPDSAEAQGVLDRARQTLATLDQSAREARTAFERGDMEAATRALGQVLAIDPRHPVASELTAALNTYFRKQAEDAKGAAVRSRTEAEKARAGGQELFRGGDRVLRDAQDLLAKEQFAQATQKFLEAGDSFDRARRASEVAAASAAAAAAAAAAARATTPPSYAPPSVTVPPTQAAAPSTLAPQLPTVAPPTLAPSLPASPPAMGSGGSEQAVRRVIADFERAVNTRDLALYRSLLPSLTADQEKVLRDVFKEGSQSVVITVDSPPVIENGQATVRVSRQDTVKGKAMRPRQQTFRLVQKGGVWTIQSMGQ